MKTIYAPHAADSNKLASVIAEMREQGAPTIRAVWCGDCYRAIEGSHRLAAAASLGLTPIVVEISEDDIIKHDIEDLASPCSAAELLEYLSDGKAAYDFEGL